jgi:hypothetical protein
MKETFTFPVRRPGKYRPLSATALSTDLMAPVKQKAPCRIARKGLLNF